jgi:hypothetical protein
MTGVAGTYDPQSFKYQPPAGYENWEALVTSNRMQIDARDKLLVYS